MGVWERINMVAWLVWVAVLSVMLMIRAARDVRALQ